MSNSRTFHSLHLDISTATGNRICYIILPECLKETEHSWLDHMAETYDTNMVVISGLNWGTDLTPWKAPGVKGGEFEGKAKSFLDRLKEDLFVNIESSLRLSNPKRFLIGVSLSGLFGTWAAFVCSRFAGVGSVSGSLWYDGFTEWIRTKENTTCTKFYFSLGEKEKEGRNPRLSKVEVATLEVIEHIKTLGASTHFEHNEGNHFGPLIERIEKAVVWTLSEYRHSESTEL